MPCSLSARLSEQYQAEVKIISGYYSPINGTQTNEEGNGSNSSQLTGKCVYMRDHLTDAAPAYECLAEQQ